jgi:hypothetical protein
MARYKSPRPRKELTAQQKAGAIPCLILIALIFGVIGLVLWAAMRGA